jgi:hypothetical protein
MDADATRGVESQHVEQDRRLLEAWRPFQAVFKAIWWEQVPMPEDLSDEAEWRSQLKCVRHLVSPFPLQSNVRRVNFMSTFIWQWNDRATQYGQEDALILSRNVPLPFLSIGEELPGPTQP